MIKLIKGYPYDNTYDYIKLHQTKAAQTNWFNSFGSIIIDEGEEEGYIREGKAFIVDYNYDYLVDQGVNYVIWNNGYKDLFCFITAKEYVDEEMTRLYYEIDVLNTYLFDFTLNKSFVERKKCTISELTDFDEGLNVGDFIIESEQIVFNKDATYFAMFNGIKEQSILFDANGHISNVVQMPCPTSKPLTMIDGIQYPLYFMPLKESYKDATLGDVILPPDQEGSKSNVVTSARKLIGKPYVWGGNYPPLGDSAGTDCSGLIMWAYNDNNLLGKYGPDGRWVTSTMLQASQPIEQGFFKPGDVIFSNFETPTNPGHVVLVSDVNGAEVRIIEAQQDGVPILERWITYDRNTMKCCRFPRRYS